MGVPERVAGVTRKFLGAVGRVRGQGHVPFLGEGGEKVMDGGYLQPEARQCGRVGRVGVHDPAHVRFRTVETCVHRDFAGGLQGPFQDFAVEAYEHYVFGLQNVVSQAARGYQDVSLGGAGADVARGRGHEARGAHLASDPGYLFAQLSMFHARPPSLIAIAYDGVKTAHSLTADLANRWSRAGPAARAPRTPLEPAVARPKTQEGRAVRTSGRRLRCSPSSQSPYLPGLRTSVAGGARRGGPLCDRLAWRRGTRALPK